MPRGIFTRKPHTPKAIPSESEWDTIKASLVAEQLIKQDTNGHAEQGGQWLISSSP